MAPTTLNFDPELGAALGFDARTLKANHEGHMTRDQQDHLRVMRTKAMRPYIGWMLCFSMLSILSLIVLQSMSIPNVMLKIGLFLLALRQGVRAWRYWQRSRTEIESREVRIAAGLLRKHHKGSRNLHIERTSFYNVPPHIYDALEAGKRYRIYFTPQTRQILSAQPIDPGELLDTAWN